MYIKTITIQGFKSYRDQTQIEPFSPKHNVVVGRNGSGKSNFFSAIRFVLSDAYTSMSREERQALLHEGVSTNTTLSAYVEIVFDNSDNRFPTGNDEVVLRRTIGLKKDEYSLDKKSASKAEIMNLLESAGFSKSNPYYIVPQGRITALTNAKDHERLALLKEVAGTKVYETRRTESLKILADTQSKRATINSLLSVIEARLQELEEEKEELKDFQEKDKERRCLEYALYARELEEVGEALGEVEEERKGEVHGANMRRVKWGEREREIQALEKEITETKHKLESTAQSRTDVQSELTDFIRTRTELLCIIQDLQASQSASQSSSSSSRTDFQNEVSSIRSRITEKETALDKIRSEWGKAREKETNEKRALEDANARLNALFAKQGRASKFRTRAERDGFLRKEITAVSIYLSSQEDLLASTRKERDNALRSREEIKTLAETTQEKLEEGKRQAKEVGEEVSKLKEEQAELSEKRKELWREDARLDSLLSRAADEMRNAERTLSGMMDKDTSLGLKAVDSITSRHNLPGVYGPLYRLFTVSDPAFNTAVELTAGNSLFHVVVDSDTTASRLLEIMLREKSGRVTFMPLNRIKPKVIDFPPSADAEPLVKKLVFDDRVRKAFLQVFGKTSVCRDLNVAAEYTRSFGINAITLDGDKVDRKGSLTGGYHDIRRSRLEGIKNLIHWRKKYDDDRAASEEVKKGITMLEQEITRVNGSVTILNGQLAQLRVARERAHEELGVLGREKEKVEERISKLESELEELESEISTLKNKVGGYETELNMEWESGGRLTAEEGAMVESLGREVERRRKDLVEVGRKRGELETTKNSLEIELKERLLRRLDEVQLRLEALDDADVQGDDGQGTGGQGGNLESRQKELKNLEGSVTALGKKVASLEKQTDTLNAHLATLLSSLDALQTQQSEDSRSISKQQKHTERYLAKKQLLLTRREECNRNIRDLGVLPEEAFERYVGERGDKLVRKLQKTNDALKKYAHVNKKAFEQYTSFTKQRDSLLARLAELDTSHERIEELVSVLDQRKDEAIERTFKMVARNFEEVFESLVPVGRGRLVMIRRVDDEERDDDSGSDNEGPRRKKSSVDSYTGVAIKVSFNSKSDEGLLIQQLSGGQKSLVALATVFAIQKCDPAPFYLFDEIDANLDAQYRTAVASMIHTLSPTAQFITTTFRPEMLVTADKFYGVLFNNQKVSSIRSIKQEEAMEFVEKEAQAQ